MDEAVDGQQVREGHGQGRHEGRVEHHDPVADEGVGDDGEEPHPPGQEQQGFVHVGRRDAAAHGPAQLDAPGHEAEAPQEQHERRTVQEPAPPDPAREADPQGAQQDDPGPAHRVQAVVEDFPVHGRLGGPPLQARTGHEGGVGLLGIALHAMPFGLFVPGDGNGQDAIVEDQALHGQEPALQGLGLGQDPRAGPVLHLRQVDFPAQLQEGRVADQVHEGGVAGARGQSDGLGQLRGTHLHMRGDGGLPGLGDPARDEGGGVLALPAVGAGDGPHLLPGQGVQGHGPPVVLHRHAAQALHGGVGGGQGRGGEHQEGQEGVGARGTGLAEAGEEHHDHARDEGGVAREDDDLSWIPGNGEDGGLPALTLLVAGLVQGVAPVPQFVVHPDAGRERAARVPVGDAHVAGESRRAHGARVDIHDEVVQGDVEGQLMVAAGLALGRGQLHDGPGLALPQGEPAFHLPEVGDAGPREDEEHGCVGEDETHPLFRPGEEVGQGHGQVEGQQALQAQEPPGVVHEPARGLGPGAGFHDGAGRKSHQDQAQQDDGEPQGGQECEQFLHGTSRRPAGRR